MLNGRRKAIALAVAADEEPSLNQFAQQFFSPRRAELPEPGSLGRGQTHSRHLTKLGSCARGQIGELMHRLSRVDHRDFSVARFLHFGCHRRLTKIREFRDYSIFWSSL